MSFIPEIRLDPGQVVTETLRVSSAAGAPGSVIGKIVLAGHRVERIFEKLQLLPSFEPYQTLKSIGTGTVLLFYCIFMLAGV